MYCLTHKTDRFRLLHKKDGSYVLQEEWVNEYAITKDGKYKKWWEDMTTIEEKDLEEDINVYMTPEEFTHQGEKKVIDVDNGKGYVCYHWEKK